MSDSNWDSVHFKSEEFDSPDAPGSGVNMDMAFVRKLDRLRDEVGRPVSIHSGYRTSEHNAKVGGVDASAHETGHAADLHAPTGKDKFEILGAAIRLGFRRIGIGNSFIHIDDSLSHPQDVCWTYPTKG